MTPKPLCAATHRITLAVDALHRLLTAPTPPTKNQQKALDVLQSWIRLDLPDWCDDKDACQALATLVGTDFNQTCEHFGAFVGPLLVWASQQPWAQYVQESRAFSAICNLHFVRQSRTQPYDTSIAALESVLEWSPSMPPGLMRALSAHTMQDVNTKMLWAERRNSSSIQKEDELIIAQLLYRLSQQCPTHHFGDRPGATMVEHWTQAMTAYATASMTLDDQHDWLRSVLQNNTLGPEFKRIISKTIVADVWLESDIEPHLQTLLPTLEEERFECLPWAVPRSPSWTRALSNALPEDTNRSLLRAYCPDAERLLGGVITAQDWKNQTLVGSLVAQISRSSEPLTVLALPNDLL